MASVQASVELQILVLIAVIAAAAVTSSKFYEDRKMRDLALWLSRRYPESWQKLPWVVRTANRASAVQAFRNDPEFDDPEIERRYAETRRGRRLQTVGLVVAVAAIALAVIGNQVLGWTLQGG